MSDTNLFVNQEAQLRILRDILQEHEALPKLLCLQQFLGWSEKYSKTFLKEYKKEKAKFEKARAAEYAAYVSQAKVELAPQTLITENGTCDCGGSCGNV